MLLRPRACSREHNHVDVMSERVVARVTLVDCLKQSDVSWMTARVLCDHNVSTIGRPIDACDHILASSNLLKVPDLGFIIALSLAKIIDFILNLKALWLYLDEDLSLVEDTVLIADSNEHAGIFDFDTRLILDVDGVA